jgi:hypothetical protein
MVFDLVVVIDYGERWVRAWRIAGNGSRNYEQPAKFFGAQAGTARRPNNFASIPGELNFKLSPCCNQSAAPP